MTTALAYLLIASIQSSPAPQWTHVSGEPGSLPRVTQLRGVTIPKRLTCHEAQFEATGLDAITESSFLLIVTVVVDRAGQVRRFRVERQPPIAVDLTSALRQAFVKWRYTVPPELKGEAFRFVVPLQKPRGAAATAACN